MENWFSIEGRIGRGKFFLRNLGIFAITMVLCFLAGAALALAGFTVDDRLANGVSGAIELAMIPVWLMQAIKRCLDMNISGLWSLLLMLPVVSLVLLFVPGTRGPNNYGADPQRANMLMGVAVADPLS